MSNIHNRKGKSQIDGKARCWLTDYLMPPNSVVAEKKKLYEEEEKS